MCKDNVIAGQKQTERIFVKEYDSRKNDDRQHGWDNGRAGCQYETELSCCMDCNILFYSHIAALRLLLCYLFQIICKEIYVGKLAG